jgi:hypothetical protein
MHPRILFQKIIGPLVGRDLCPISCWTVPLRIMLEPPEPARRWQFTDQDFPTKCDDPRFPSKSFTKAGHSLAEIAPVERPSQRLHVNAREVRRDCFSTGGDIPRFRVQESRSHGSGLKCTVGRNGDPSQSPSTRRPARPIVTSFLKHE